MVKYGPLLIGLLFVLGCENKNSVTPRQEVGTLEMRLALLNHAGRTITNTQADALLSAQELVAATSALSSNPPGADPISARTAWARAAEQIQLLEVMQVGPAGNSTDVLGGEDQRDEMYSWPLVNPCRVDQELVSQSYADSAAFAALPVNVRGLDALEYVLFSEGTDNACPATILINTDGSWDALSEEELDQRRRDFALAAAQDLEARIQALSDTWSNGFLAKFTDPTNHAVYGSTREAINALSNAMFYVDTDAKDIKVAIPAGISGCTTETCPELRESQFGNASLQHIRQNLIGFDQLYHGGARDSADAVGFDDLLISIGEQQLNTLMVQLLDAAIARVDALNGSLDDALRDDLNGVIALHTALRDLSDLLKTSFISVLDLDLPQKAEGDND